MSGQEIGVLLSSRVEENRVDLLLHLPPKSRVRKVGYSFPRLFSRGETVIDAFPEKLHNRRAWGIGYARLWYYCNQVVSLHSKQQTADNIPSKEGSNEI